MGEFEVVTRSLWLSSSKIYIFGGGSFFVCQIIIGIIGTDSITTESYEKGIIKEIKNSVTEVSSRSMKCERIIRERGFIMEQKILIGGAWPYANGSLHIGHIAGLLPGDVLARYHRAIGNDVYYVSGSDCHGTPVTIRARQEGRTADEICEEYHREFAGCFEGLGFSYDIYGKTTDALHKDFVREFHKKLYASKYVYEKTQPQSFCPHCNQFLPDRYVEGRCPVCGESARGDQCDACGAVLETEGLQEPKCLLCGNAPEFRESRHLYLKVTELRTELGRLLADHPNWRRNAIAMTERYLLEGLRDKALTRDLNWGIDVPYKGYENKKIYIWAENVLGYLSMSAEEVRRRGADFKDLWGINARHYYVHAKDNIPFHTIILPALLMAQGEGYHLPDDIISNEYLTLEGRKISTSNNHAIWVKDILEEYNPDAIRYFLLANGPQKRDTDFTFHEFAKSCNSELAGTYGNFINRTLVFLHRYSESSVTEGILEKEVEEKIIDTYTIAGGMIEKGAIKEALENIFGLARFANKYYDSKAPWITRIENRGDCDNTLYNCTQLAGNLGILLAPFLPFSSGKVLGWLGLVSTWKLQHVPAGTKLPESEILFQRIA